MAEDLLERILREIRERKRSAQAAFDESQRLERALAALTPQRGADAAPAAAGTRSRSAQRRPRAPRGANREAILAVVRERPGVTVGEIALATGIARATVSSTMARLSGAGSVERTELPGGGVGFRPAPEPEASAPVVTGGGDQEASAEAPA